MINFVFKQEWRCKMKGDYFAESKNVEALVDQIGQNTKNELFPHKLSHTHYLKRASRYWWKEVKVILLGVFYQLGRVTW